MACWSTKAAISLKCVKIEEKLLCRAHRKSPTLFQFLGLPPYFYFRFRLYGHRDGRFCLIFARTAQQLVLDGTMDFLASTMCILLDCASRGHLCDSIAFLFYVFWLLDIQWKRTVCWFTDSVMLHVHRAMHNLTLAVNANGHSLVFEICSIHVDVNV